MGVNDSDPAEIKIQLELCRERQRYSEDGNRRLEQELAQVYTNLGRKEKELEQIKEDRTDLKIKWEVLKKDFQYAQAALSQSSHVTSKKRTMAKLQAFLASIIFLLSSVIANFATGVLTSNPPNPSLGWSMLGLAASVYIIGALMTTVLVLEGGN